MRLSHRLALALSLVVSPALAGNDPPRHQLRASADGNRVIGLCDGETSLEVKGVKPGDQMTREQGQQIADALMTEWRQKHPDAEWVVAAADGGGGTVIAPRCPVKRARSREAVSRRPLRSDCLSTIA